MPEDGVTLTPTVLWAQRKDRLLITIDLPNPEHPRIDLEDDGNMTFSATAGKDGEERRRYEVSLEFMHPVIARDSKISVGNRQVFVMVMKTKEVSGRDPTPTNPRAPTPIPRFNSPGSRSHRVPSPSQRRVSVAIHHKCPGDASIHPRIGPSQNTNLCRRLPFSPSSLTSLTNRIHPSIIPQPSSQFSGEHWPRLLKAKGKVPHVKTDFDKWVDEDEEEENDRDAAFDLAKLQELSTYEHSTYDDKFYDDEDDMSDADDDMPDLERI